MKNLLLLFLTTITLITFAKSEKESVTYSKNDSIVEGKAIQYIEKIRNETEITNSRVFINFENDSIAKVQNGKNEIEYSKKGYFNSSSFGVLLSSNSPVIDISLKVINGYQMNENHAIGIGLAVESFSTVTFHTSLDYRYYLLKKRTTPYGNVYGGYSFSGSDNNDYFENYGGVNYGLALGLRHYFSNKTAIDVSIGYAYQFSSAEYYDWNLVNYRKYDIEHNRIAIRIGFLFN